MDSPPKSTDRRFLSDRLSFFCKYFTIIINPTEIMKYGTKTILFTLIGVKKKRFGRVGTLQGIPEPFKPSGAKGCCAANEPRGTIRRRPVYR